MPDISQLPFHSFSFSLVQDKKPRAAFRMKALEDGMYELHVERGSASNPISQFTRKVPMDVAQRLKDNLQAAGVFGWDESYGDAAEGGMLRWNLSTVFKEGVFSLASHGGNDVPQGFDALLEELYRLDFPRPEQPRAAQAGFGQTGVPAGLGGFGADASGIDYSQLANMMRDGGLEGLGASEMLELLNEARSNPQAIQQRLRDEFRHMPPDEQERMLDMLASSGMATRAWWERFLRG